jgi:hypothetical protein
VIREYNPEQMANGNYEADEPILNNPFEEPKGYLVYEEGQPGKMSELAR